jgi:hypothetical protein
MIFKNNNFMKRKILNYSEFLLLFLYVIIYYHYYFIQNLHKEYKSYSSIILYIFKLNNRYNKF